MATATSNTNIYHLYFSTVFNFVINYYLYEKKNIINELKLHVMQLKMCILFQYWIKVLSTETILCPCRAEIILNSLVSYIFS